MYTSYYNMNESEWSYPQAVHILRNGGLLHITKETITISPKNGAVSKRISARTFERIMPLCRLVQSWSTGHSIYMLKG